jgi:hypothetical protein
MSQTEFTRMLSNLDALSPEQMATLRGELDSKTALPVPAAAKRAAPMSEHDFKRQLLNSGLMSSLPTPADPASRPAFQPIAVDGEPLSETIIRERR